MSATRIRITSLETPEDFFVFEAKTLALAVSKCVTELQDVWTFEYEESLATLLKTIGEAIESPEGTAQEWDFSSPGDAYKVEIETTDHTEDNDHDSRKAGVEPIAPHQTISFVDPSGKNGLLDVDPADCRFDVSAVQCEGNRWRLTAEAHNTKDGGEDGWYAFLEGYQHNRKLGHFGAVFCHLNGWMFETAADALATAQVWCKELGVQPAINDTLSLQDNPAPVPGPKKITAIEQRIKHGDCAVHATFDDGSRTLLFNYYIDELSFSDSEFIGLTQKEAMALRHKKDVAYLQS